MRRWSPCFVPRPGGSAVTGWLRGEVRRSSRKVQQLGRLTCDLHRPDPTLWPAPATFIDLDATSYGSVVRRTALFGSSQELSDEVSDNRHGQRWTPADTHGQSVPGQACCDAGSPRLYLASGRRGHSRPSEARKCRRCRPGWLWMAHRGPRRQGYGGQQGLARRRTRRHHLG
jgi:hypothetical protein